MNPPLESGSEFEARLRRQVIRPVPAEWRDTILRRTGVTPVSSSTQNHTAALTQREDRRDACPTWWSRLGWIGLGAAWVLIFALHIAGRPEPLGDSAGEPPAVSEAWAAWTQNQRELARLLETEPPIPPPEADRPPPRQSCIPVFIPIA